jgi:hypothetical protein
MDVLDVWRPSRSRGSEGRGEAVYLKQERPRLVTELANKFAKDTDDDLVVTTNVTKETLQATPAYTKPKQ